MGALATPTALRFLAIALTAALVTAVDPWPAERIMILAVGYSHYALALLYGRKRIAAVARSTPSLIGVLTLAALSVVSWRADLSLVLLFGMHHVINEAFLETAPGEPDARLRSGLRAALTVAVYAFLLRRNEEFAVFPPQLVAGACAMLFLAYGAALWPHRARMTRDAWLRATGVEIASLVAMAVSLFVRIKFFHVVLYHFVFWALIPLPALARGGRRPLLGYGVATLGTLAVAFFFSPLGPKLASGQKAVWVDYFYFGSHFHIITSLGLSRANPAFLRGLFERAPRPAAA